LDYTVSQGHPEAIGLQFDEDLSDETERDILDQDDFEETLGSAGINEDSTVVFYGDGHEDTRVLDGGKGYWVIR
jgi:thiosulfate/3-mercaptopyruvate sulfurtransferase